MMYINVHFEKMRIILDYNFCFSPFNSLIMNGTEDLAKSSSMAWTNKTMEAKKVE